MRLSAKCMRRTGMVLVSVLVAVIPATAGLTAPNQGSHLDLIAVPHSRAADYRISAKSQVIPNGALDNCIFGAYCDFSRTSGAHNCEDWGLDGPLNWAEQCRNHDESFANKIGGPVRLYYSPDEEGAWACVSNGWYSNDLNKDAYTFDNGSGSGAGQEIWENIASSDAAHGRCTHPLPEDG